MYGCSGKCVGRHVKLYLTIFHRVAKALRDGKNNPSAIRQPDLITLMNLEPILIGLDHYATFEKEVAWAKEVFRK
jgi:hypothetical protein